jgi:hypothetical protein
MDRSEIKLGMKVIDRKLGMTYTWIKYYGVNCSMCLFPATIYLYEDDVSLDNFRNPKREKFCIDCAGVQDLEPIVKAV